MCCHCGGGAAPGGRRLDGGAACDLDKCVCDGVDLSALRGQIFSTPANGAGHIFNFTICDELPPESDCAFGSEHAAVIKYCGATGTECAGFRAPA